ncbi:SDR family oxidoreductase [Streptomyces sp. FXJ1.4098]|nr:SDR family oxidoreductase [Streptomyces sp. FXJ1.4098]
MHGSRRRRGVHRRREPLRPRRHPREQRLRTRGHARLRPFLRLTGEVWDEFHRVNLGLLFHPTHRMARTLADAEKPGTVVNISSHAAARAHRNHIPYDTVKGGVDSFTRAVAVDLAPWNIRVNALRPGSVRSTPATPTRRPATSGPRRSP